MRLRIRLCATMAVIGGAILFCGGIAIAEWTEPICFTELNDFEATLVAGQASLSADERVICFQRGEYILMEAYREDPDGPFEEERVVSELGYNGMAIPDAWISADGLRLYYAEIFSLAGKMQRVIKMAKRDSLPELWVENKTFLEIHVNGIVDTSPALSGDELTMIWYNLRVVGVQEPRTYIATRASIEEPFSNIREIPELSNRRARHPHLSPDGLTVHFTAPSAETGKNNIFKGARESLDAPFANFEVLDDFCGPDLPASRPWLSPDEKTIYFNSVRGETLDEKGIWVSYWIDDPYDAAVESIEAAIAAKREAIAAIASGLDKDREVLEALNELGETGDIDPAYIEPAKRHVLNAIRRQMKAIAELEKSIRELEKALGELEGTGNPGKKPDNPVRQPREPKAPLIK